MILGVSEEEKSKSCTTELLSNSHALNSIISTHSPQLRFEKIKGVARCIVGYAGGLEPKPTYKSIKDHTEALLVEYDPNTVSYEDLVISWTQMHKPNYERGRQYRSAIWYVNEEQEENAIDVIKGWKAAAREPLYTSLEQAKSFYRAEEYHQYFLRKRGGQTRWA
jgi:peptide-methionine (S)-S-oxide reductase